MLCFGLFQSHALSLRRAVPGRIKPFDDLLKEHRAAKEALLKEKAEAAAAAAAMGKPAVSSAASTATTVTTTRISGSGSYATTTTATASKIPATTASIIGITKPARPPVQIGKFPVQNRFVFLQICNISFGFSL